MAATAEQLDLDLARLGGYWHGGPAGLTKIVPPAASGTPSFDGRTRRDQVYITPHSMLARMFAAHFDEPMLYAVWPDSEPVPDPEVAHHVANRGSLMTTSATILYTVCPTRDDIAMVRSLLTAAARDDGLSPDAMLAEWRIDARPCELCAAKQRTPRLHEDDICWIALCEICDVPMVVWKRHSVDPTGEDLAHMGAQLCRVANGFFGSAWEFDASMRSIPDHFHAHARPLPAWI
jgi:hypothetical protein